MGYLGNLRLNFNGKFHPITSVAEGKVYHDYMDRGMDGILSGKVPDARSMGGGGNLFDWISGSVIRGL